MSLVTDARAVLWNVIAYKQTGTFLTGDLIQGGLPVAWQRF